MSEKINNNNDWMKVKKMHIRDIVKNEEWQMLRKSLLGKWSDCKKCTNILKQYVVSKNNTSEFPYAVRRVLNYMTGSYFRIYYKLMCQSFKTLLNKIRKVYKLEENMLKY